MSLTLLLEKYDVSTEEGLQKALNEIEKEEFEVNEALSNALSRACTLEGKLRTASQAYTKLGEVRSDAQIAADMVDRTAALAKDVSAKVRQLDLARSRVAECQQRVHDLIDLTVCSAGVDAAIKAHDYETGHVARFLSMEPGSVAAARARGAPDPRRDMDVAADTLRDHLVRKFEEAARKEDEAATERLFKLFPQIGRADEGVELLGRHLAAQLETAVRRAGAAADRGAGAVYADSLTRVLETGAAAVERARALLADCGAPPPAHAPAHPPAHPRPPLARAVALLQPAVCAGVRRVCSELIAARRPGPERGDPRAVEPALDELALAHSRLQLYFGFLRRRPELSYKLDEKARAACSEAIEKIILECDSTRAAQDLLAHYLELERYFLEESASKALRLSGADSASSLVDDAFFIARRVIRRAVSTGSVDGACAVINEAGAALERCGAALRRRLASPPLDPLPLPAPPRAPAAPPAPPRDPDPQRALYLAHASEAATGAEWAERLADEAVRAADALCRDAGARAKLRSVASGLGAAAATFRAAHELALEALRAALRPAGAQWAAALVAPDGDPDESEEEAGALPAALDALAEAARARLPRGAEALLGGVLADLLARAEAAVLENRYDRRGGLCVERRCRRLAGWAGGEAPGARGRAGALAATGALLGAESPALAADALAPGALAPARVRDVLARRTDFKLEEIRRLKL